MNYRDTELFKAFLPLLNYMKVFGLYHNRAKDTIVENEVENETEAENAFICT